LCENIALLEFAIALSPARAKGVSWMRGAQGKQRDNTVNARKFRAFIEHSVYPCLGAEAAFNIGAYERQDFRSENEAALRDGTRQRGSGHGYYFTAERMKFSANHRTADWDRRAVPSE